MQIDHQPSFAAQLKAAENAKGAKLTKKEENQLRQNTPAVASPTGVHRQSPTTGGRNTKKQIAEDANDLGAAAKRNKDAFDKSMAERDKGSDGADKNNGSIVPE